MVPTVLQRHSLKTRITIATLLIFLAGIWSLSYYATRILRQDMERLLGEQQLSAVSMIAEQVERELAHRLETLKTVAELSAPALLAGPTALQLFLQRQPHLQVPFNGGVFATGTDGTAIAALPFSSKQIGMNYGDRDYLISALRDGKATVSRPLIGKNSQGPVFVMTVPIRNKQGKITGALAGVTHLGESNFLDQVSQSRHGKNGGYILVAAEQRTIVTASDPNHELQTLATRGSNALFDHFVAGDEGSGVATDPQGVEMLYSVKNVPLAAWRAIVFLPTAEVFAPIRDLQQRMRFAALVLTLLAGGLIWWVLRRQLFPLQLTATTLATLSESGQPLQLLPVARNDEIGQLICAFNRLLSERKRSEEAIRSSEAKLRRAELGSKSGHWELHLDSGTVIGSAGAIRLAGIDRIRSDTAAIRKTILPEYLPVHDAALKRLIENGEPYDIELKIRTADSGKIKDVHSIAEFDPQRRIVFGITQDIVAHKQSEARLQLAANVFSHVREGIMITDDDGLIVEVNDAFSRVTGFDREDAIGRNPRILKSGRQAPEFYRTMWQTLTEQGYWTGELWNQRQNGELYVERLTVSAVRDTVGKLQNYVGLFTDITDEKAHQKQLERVAHYDSLTSLPNRVLLADRLQQAIAQSHRNGQSLAVAYLDLDDFKAVNDQYGHGSGDELLVAVAQAMRDALRDGDTLARIGGDEFVAVLTNLDEAHGCQPALERLLLAAAAPVSIDSASIQVSVSVGVTLYPQDGADADLLLRHADQALYVAKQAGKNRYHQFDVAEDVAASTQRGELQQLAMALEQRELLLHFQPKVNMRTGAVIGAEALIRWQHPERGLLPPGAFLPLAENHPLAIDIGEWVIATALAQIESWRALGLDIPISVNIGARQLQQADFVDRLRQMLAAHPTVRPGELEMEVLESSALDDLVHVSQVIRDCQSLGVNFALDDFGTGYSSLTYLKRLPVAMLKIDQSFVHDMLNDPDDLAILEGIIGLASAFRREVIAEGVETVEHGEMLLKLGCELAQGYGIARPMPAARFPAWASAWRPDSAWSNRSPIDRDDLPLLFASVEHRAWVAAVEDYIQDDNSALPPLAIDQCRFAIWLKSKGRARYADQPDFQVAERLHQRTLGLVAQLCELRDQGRKPEVLGRLGELHFLTHALLSHLKSLQGEQPLESLYAG